MPQKIVIRGARVHNLKNIDLEIPRDQLVVITGVSGSGKSSLAFDTLYAEGQRRYIESLSADTRQLLHQLDKPDVESIEGLSPTIAIEQSSANFGPRSTVGTVSEVYDFLRLLFARIGQPSCTECGRAITAQSIDQIVDQLMSRLAGARIFVLARVPSEKGSDQPKILRELVRAGFSRIQIDGRVHELSEDIKLKSPLSRIDLVVDRLVLRAGIERRLADSLEVASRVGRGVVGVEVHSEAAGEPIQKLSFSQQLACSGCGSSFPELTPGLFSFNSPQGACPVCEGLGIAEKQARKTKRLDATGEPLSCAGCEGTRLKHTSLAVSVGGNNIAQVAALPVADAIRFLEQLPLEERQRAIGERIIRDIICRLRFLVRVGLEYLSLDRRSATLSGGEAQRVRLAKQLGSSLAGVIYLLDEPSIGLHQKDNVQLLGLLKELRDAGNSVIVVEHDSETIQSADYVIDMGPGAGIQGGQVVACGTPQDLMAQPHSLTGQYLWGHKRIPVPPKRRQGSGEFLVVKGATRNNLQDVTVEFPIGLMTCVTGVSGSGKSTLVVDVLSHGVARHLRRAPGRESSFEALIGWQHFDRVIVIDQSPIGRTLTSNPATYSAVYDHIRDLFAQLPSARVRGYKANRFSFNVSGGRCEACGGAGVVRINMVFLPDIFVTCDGCRGRRYNRETLEIRYKGLNIADVLELTVSEALEVLGNIPSVLPKLRLLGEVGLGYLRLGQPASTLSGGEAQRVKLAKELSRKSAGRSLYILDEPTAGLHYADIEKLLSILHRLTDSGNTIIIVEHNLDVIKSADYIIDLGPEGGEKGGQVVAAGRPESIAVAKDSYTGQYLAKTLA